MKNLTRAVRIALRYRWSLVALAASSLAVAVLWGANLGTVYPIVGVVLKQRSLRDWVDENIATSRARCDELRTRIADTQQQLAAEQAGQRWSLERQLIQDKAVLAAETQALKSSRYMQPWIHRYMPARPFPTLVLVVIVLLVGTLLKTVFLVSNAVLVERITQLVTFDLRNLLYRNTLRMDLAHFGQDRTSTLLSHFTHDMEGITAGIRTVFGRAVREPLKIMACLAGAAFVCWRLLLFCLIVTPVAIYLINRLAGSVKRANRRAMDEMAGVYSHLTESFNGIQVVKAFTMEPHERRCMHQRCRDYLRKAMRIAIYNSFTKPCTELMSIGVVCLAILTGGYLVLNQATELLGIRMCYRPLNFESLMTFFALLAGVSDPFRKLAEVYNQIQRGAAAADRVYALVDRRPSVRDVAQPLRELPPLEHLELRNVDFHYQVECPVLQDVSLRIQAGHRIAIVGPNGCGKSSLLNLLPRFYDPTEGSVEWNGVDLRQVRLRSLRRKIGIVTQHTLLFDDTVLNNIRYGKPQATDLEVVAAARKAHAHQFITEKLPHGYQTTVGQGGELLSGGQRQRIALARAILRDPEILLLDEATSQVDLESERLIHQALREFTVGRTTLIITHRLSTLSLADQVVVMHAGRVVDAGPHTELLGRCGLYQRLHQGQFRVTA